MSSPNDSQLLQDISEKVNLMFGALFGATPNNGGGFVKETSKDLENHNRRITRLEKWAWSVAGGIGVITFLIAHHLFAAAGK